MILPNSPIAASCGCPGHRLFPAVFQGSVVTLVAEGDDIAVPFPARAGAKRGWRGGPLGRPRNQRVECKRRRGRVWPRLWRRTLEHERAVAPKSEVKAGIIPGTRVGLEAEDQHRTGRPAQVVFEVLPGGVGPMNVQQFSRTRHDPECHTVGLAHAIRTQRRGPAQQRSTGHGKLDVKLLERKPRAISPRAVQQERRSAVLYAHGLAGNAGLLVEGPRPTGRRSRCSGWPR